MLFVVGLLFVGLLLRGVDDTVTVVVEIVVVCELGGGGGGARAAAPAPAPGEWAMLVSARVGRNGLAATMSKEPESTRGRRTWLLRPGAAAAEAGS